ncbi:MAG: hypothetical protein V1838_02110 [Patescibacteria group bacterium]
MTQQNIFYRATTFIFRELIFDIFRFPLWWYGRGTANAARFVGGEMADWSNRLSLRILLRNMFKPMYGDYTRSGRAISFMVRIVMFIVKFIVFMLWSVLMAALFILWLALPIAIVYFIYLNITGNRLIGT